MSPARLLHARLRPVALPVFVLFASSQCAAADQPHAPNPAGKAFSPFAALDLSFGDLTHCFNATELATPLPDPVLLEPGAIYD